MSAGESNPGRLNREPELLVIGAGSAGFSAAITAAEAGASVVLAGAGTLGGTCVNVGCVPSKHLIRAVGAVHAANRVSRFAGLSGQASIGDWQALIRQKRALVEALRQRKYVELLDAWPNIAYLSGQSHFTGRGIEVAVDAARIRPRKIVLATGASAALPSLDGIDSVPVLDSTAALELETLPASLLVIGGGVIACELGQMFARAGVQVTICCRRRLLPAVEPEVSTALAAQFAAEGISVCAGIGYQRIEQVNGLIRLHCRTQAGTRVLEAEQVLAATGRRPNTAMLGVEQAGIELDANGGVIVDRHLRTSHPDVYAAGDVTGRDMHVYMAAYGGKLAARNALQATQTSYDNSAMPAVVFSDPQVATVGLSEADARARGHAVSTSLIGLDQVPRFIVDHAGTGLIKLVAEADSDRLLGATIFAPEAGDSIQTVVMALKAGLSAAELGDTLFPYLTAVEGLKLAAQAFSKDVSKLSCCAG